MINLRKTIVNLGKFTEYVGHFCGYDDHHVFDKLDDLTTNSLHVCVKKIEDLPNCDDPYYVNLKEHIYIVINEREFQETF